MRSGIDINIDTSEIPSANTDIVTQLPSEIVGHHIISRLQREDIFHSYLVSKAWHGFFNRAIANDILVWQKLIANHFNISLRVQWIFTEYAKPESISGEMIYRSLAYVQRHLSLLPKHLRGLLGSSRYQWQWLAWATGNEILFEKAIPIEETFTWLSMTLRMRPMFPFESLMLRHKMRALDLFHVALKSAHLPAIRFLLKNDDKFPIQLEQDHLNKAAKTGNLALVVYLFNYAREKNIGLVIDVTVAEHAALSGNLSLMRWIGIPRREIVFTQALFEKALTSGNIDLVNWVYEKMMGEVDVTHEALRCAAHSGNVDLVTWLLTFDLAPNHEILRWAALSGNPLLVDMLLKYFYDHQIDYIVDFLDMAIVSKNKILVKNLLSSAPLDDLFYTINKETFRYALMTGDVELIKIVWNWMRVYSSNLPADYFQIGEDELEAAACSGQGAAFEWALTHNFSLRRINNRILEAALLSENIALVWMILDPRRSFYVLFDMDFSFDMIMPYNLICCDQYVKKAFSNIGKKEGETWLDKAYDKSPRHCYRMILHVLFERFFLYPAHHDWLWNQLLFLATQKTCLPIELQEIQTMIDRARGMLFTQKEEMHLKLNAFEEKLHEVNARAHLLNSLKPFVTG